MSLKLLLPLLLAVGLLAPVASPVDAAAPRAETQRGDVFCYTDPPYFSSGTLPALIEIAAGNGTAGRTLAMTAAEAPGGPVTYPSELMSRAKPSLTRAKLEAMEHRGVRTAYFSGWHAQVRQQTRRLVAQVKACPDEAQVLLGYSQGALVVRAVLRNLSRTAKGRKVLDHLAGVVLIGDPAADRREKITRYGGAKGRGVIAARIPLPRVLVARGLVTSVCAANDPVCSSTAKSRKGKLTKMAGRKAVRSHLAYDVGRGQWHVDTRAEKAVVAMSQQLVRRYAAAPQWSDVCRASLPASSSPCYSLREGDSFSAPLTSAAGYRLVTAATTLPAGVSVAPDLTLSGVVPDRDHDDFVVGFTSLTIAPAVVQRAHLSLGSWPRQTARPGVRRISHALGGGRANGASSQPDVSADGQHVAFVSKASDLVAGDTNGAGVDVFVWDRATDTTKRLAVGDESTAWPDVSADGRYVEFITKAPLAGDTDALADVYVWDTQTDAVQLASPGTAVPVSAGSITPDGSTVFFRENPTSPGTGYVVRSWDRAGEAVTLVPPPAGWAWTVDPQSPRPWASSPDGRYVVAQSTSADRAAVWDRQLDAQRGVGCGVSADTVVTGPSAAVAADGSVFSFGNYYPNSRIGQTFRVVCDPMTGATTGGRSDSPRSGEFTADGRLEVRPGLPVEVYDRATGAQSGPTTEQPQFGGGFPEVPSFTADGSTVVFGTTAKNILEMAYADLGRSEVYLWDRTVSP